MSKLTPVLGADIIEGTNDFHLQVDLPGIETANLEVNINNGFLNIRAERKRMDGSGDDAFGYGRASERMYGAVQRSLPIPEGANVDGAVANFEKGVLTGKAYRKLLLRTRDCLTVFAQCPSPRKKALLAPRNCS
jgi:HSP20 family molecular chaperone IbpA